jgi:hypothetical protein
MVRKVFWFLAAVTVIACSGSTTTEPTADSAPPISAEYRKSYADVANGFEKGGYRVAPIDEQTPNVMRVTVPSTLMSGVTPQDFREMAGLARKSLLRDDAIVVIESEGGQRLARANALGID